MGELDAVLVTEPVAVTLAVDDGDGVAVGVAEGAGATFATTMPVVLVPVVLDTLDARLSRAAWLVLLVLAAELTAETAAVALGTATDVQPLKSTEKSTTKDSDREVPLELTT